MIERARRQGDVEGAHLVAVEGIEPTTAHCAQSAVRIGIIVCEQIVLHCHYLIKAIFFYKYKHLSKLRNFLCVKKRLTNLLSAGIQRRGLRPGFHGAENSYFRTMEMTGVLVDGIVDPLVLGE